MAVRPSPLDALVHTPTTVAIIAAVANFMGGSAAAMASQIAEGFILINPNTLRGYLPGDLAALKQEMERLQRDTRALAPAADDALANQAKSRKITRLSSGLMTVSNKMTAKR